MERKRKTSCFGKYEGQPKCFSCKKIKNCIKKTGEIFKTFK